MNDFRGRAHRDRGQQKGNEAPAGDRFAHLGAF
jgi:hypothetical protein